MCGNEAHINVALKVFMKFRIEIFLRLTFSLQAHIVQVEPNFCAKIVSFSSSNPFIIHTVFRVLFLQMQTLSCSIIDNVTMLPRQNQLNFQLFRA